MDNSYYEEQEPLNWFERLKYVFTKPSKLFSNLVQHPKIISPLLAIVISMAVLILIRINLFQEYIVSTQNEATGIFSTIISVLSFALFPVLILLVKSRIIHGFVPIFGGDANYNQFLSVIAYSYIPVILGETIIAIISLVQGQFDVSISFAQLLPQSMESGFLYAILAQFNIFTVWYQILAIIGVSYVYEISKKKSAIPVLLTWLSWILINGSLQVIMYWVADMQSQS
ncbi:Yip1 family protein [Sporosalibacterium faouarense]|uniref:Yip1 family protein n=1 Tax=Sporosalibacterium faouarense TaxID=516123 RepID=UPI00141D42C3|nr:Yip1 family protein [Sporosalibacterium faouarense]MTI46771.1 YIP1 family protein [Bacillota bacterium]